MKPLDDDEDDEPLDSGGLQPRTSRFRPGGDHSPEFIDALAQQDATEEARRLQRLADREVVLTLELQGFDTSTPEWDAFARALAEYGFSVILGWLITGSAFRMAASQRGGQGVLGLAKLPDDLRLDRDDATSVATETVAVAIAKFREKTLMNRDPSKRWRADGGASIKTFFVGRCLMELPDCYQRWERETKAGARLGSARRLSEFDEDDLHSQRVSPERSAVAVVGLDEVFDDGDELVRAMFELDEAGYSHEEVAEMLTAAGHPTSKAAVRTKMYRHRQSTGGQR